MRDCTQKKDRYHRLQQSTQPLTLDIWIQFLVCRIHLEQHQYAKC